MSKKRTEQLETNVKQKYIYIYLTRHTPEQVIELVYDV